MKKTKPSQPTNFKTLKVDSQIAKIDKVFTPIILIEIKTISVFNKIQLSGKYWKSYW